MVRWLIGILSVLALITFIGLQAWGGMGLDMRLGMGTGIPGAPVAYSNWTLNSASNVTLNSGATATLNN